MPRLAPLVVLGFGASLPALACTHQELALAEFVERADATASSGSRAVEWVLPVESIEREALQARLFGRVVDARGVNVAPVRLQLSRVDADGRGGFSEPAVVSDDGRFDFSGAPEGELELRAWSSDGPGVWRYLGADCVVLARGEQRALEVAPDVYRPRLDRRDVEVRAELAVVEPDFVRR